MKFVSLLISFLGMLNIAFAAPDVNIDPNSKEFPFETAVAAYAQGEVPKAYNIVSTTWLFVGWTYLKAEANFLPRGYFPNGVVKNGEPCCYKSIYLSFRLNLFNRLFLYSNNQDVAYKIGFGVLYSNRQKFDAYIDPKEGVVSSEQTTCRFIQGKRFLLCQDSYRPSNPRYYLYQPY